MKDEKYKEQTNEPMDLLDVLLDVNNREPIVLIDETGRRLAFEQIAVIPYDEEGDTILYAVLRPLDHLEGIGEDEAIVFKVIFTDEGESRLVMEDNEERAKEIFERYYDLLDQANANNKKKK